MHESEDVCVCNAGFDMMYKRKLRVQFEKYQVLALMVVCEFFFSSPYV